MHAVGLCQSTHTGVGDQESAVEQGPWSASGSGTQVLGEGLTHKSSLSSWPVQGCTKMIVCKDLWHHPVYESHH